MKIQLGNFKTKLGREDMFKQTTGNGCLHQGINDSGVRILNCTTPLQPCRNPIAVKNIISNYISKNLVVKSMMFPR